MKRPYHKRVNNYRRFLNPQDMCNGEDGLFRVLVENEACGIVGRRCAKAVTVFFQGGLIVMREGKVTSSTLLIIFYSTWSLKGHSRLQMSCFHK